jgi:hypothetical protein
MGPCSGSNLCRPLSRTPKRIRTGGHAVLVSRVTLVWFDILTAAPSGLLFLPPPYDRMYGFCV